MCVRAPYWESSKNWAPVPWEGMKWENRSFSHCSASSGVWMETGLKFLLRSSRSEFVFSFKKFNLGMTLPHHWTFSMRSSAQPWISLHIYFISYSITKHSTLSGWLLRLKTMEEIPILKLWTKYATCSLVVICSAHHWSFLTAHPLLKVQPLPACVSTSFYSPLSPSSSSLLFLPPTSYYLLNSHYY